MAKVDSRINAVQSQMIDSAVGASVCLPLAHFLSGVVLLQYVNFCRQHQHADRKSSLSFYLGTMGIVFHLGQMSVDYGVLFHSFQLYTIGSTYQYFLYEALYICCLAGTVLVVQFHFSRLALATEAASVKCVALIRVLCVGTCIGGLGTAVEYFKRVNWTDLGASGPLVNRGKLLALYIAWLACNGTTDGIITFVMAKQLYHGRCAAKHKSLRDTLNRLFNIIVNTFALTFITAFLALLAAILPHVTSNLSLQALSFSQNAGFVLNGWLSRIYLISFFSSFGETRHCAVGELASNQNHWRLDRNSSSLRWDSPADPRQLKAYKKSVQRLQMIAVTEPMQVTREVEIKVERYDMKTARKLDLKQSPWEKRRIPPAGEFMSSMRHQ